MPRRRKPQGEPIGKRFRRARLALGLTLQKAAERTGIAASSLSRFESDQSQPSFDDVRLIAREYGWPLVYFATGRLRTGADSRALAAHLFHWGLRDVMDPERPILGEVRAFEDVVAESVREGVASTLIEAVPALVLRNDFDPVDLLASARRFATVRRVGWLNEVAERISRDLELRWLHPDAARNVRTTWVAAWAEIASESTNEAPETDDHTAKGEIPAVNKRWGIDSGLSLDGFLKRARIILGESFRDD